jgi:hypothetical protein
MKKMTILSLAVVTVFSTTYAEETKAVEKAAVVKIKAEKNEAPLVSPKKPKPAECVAPAKPATPAEPAKPAEAAKAAAPATPVNPAEAAKPAPGTCPPEPAKSAD